MLAIQDAGIQVLPSIFNAVITIAVISVANSCTFGSTRTMQALAERGMALSFLSYVDKAGRPLWCVVIQIAFGLLAFDWRVRPEQDGLQLAACLVWPVLFLRLGIHLSPTHPIPVRLEGSGLQP